MKVIERRAAELRREVDDIVHQFRLVDAATAQCPPTEMSNQEIRLIEYLGDSGPRLMREPAEFLVVAVSELTGTVDNLESKGLVVRRRPQEDRRMVRVELTIAGQQVYEAVVEQKLRFLRSMLGALTDEEQEIFLLLFRKIARAGRSQVQKMKIATLA